MSPATAEVKPVNVATADIPREAYRNRLRELEVELQQRKLVDRRLVRARVIVFAVAVCLGSIAIGEGGLSWGWLLLPLAVFVGLVPLHSACISRLRRCESARAFHEGCLLRLDHCWKQRVHDGAQFSEPGHPWIVDLDIFGAGSLFQLLTECRTGPGHERLADWMRRTPELQEILVRQRRSEALRDELDLREALATVPGQIDWTAADRMLRHWVTSPAQRIPPWILWTSGILGCLAVPLAIAVACGLLPFSVLLLLMILQGPLILLTRRQIQRVFHSMDAADQALQQFADVLVLFEQHPFLEPSVRELQSGLMTRGTPASRSIRQLSGLTRWLNHSARNQFFAPLAWMCGLLVILTDRLEQWRSEHGRDVAVWLSTAAEFEALLSIAAFRFEHPQYCNPVVSTDMVIFDAEQLGHPLLSGDACVRNDVQLTADVPLMLISGSNMSGKSTLLRSVGTNLVLTFCGAVVNAGQLTTYPFQLATAMRISDSLQEGRSLFYSVVQRLKSVVDLTLQPRTVLFLLDEILHGTNSHDRRRGAEAVIRSLVDRGALGMVTTHDLALTQIVDSLGGRAVNRHFEDTIENGKMIFDYRLREGVVQRSNALELMRMLGLDV